MQPYNTQVREQNKALANVCFDRIRLTMVLLRLYRKATWWHNLDKSKSSAPLQFAPCLLSSKDISQREKAVETSFRLVLTLRFLALSFTILPFLTFALGHACRVVLLSNAEFPESPRHHFSNEYTAHGSLPQPILPTGRQVPVTKYTSKHFDTSLPASSDSVLLAHLPDMEPHLNGPLHDKPFGDHLILDIENVDEAFLNSEERLAEAMVKLVGACGLTMLSYHCHALDPMGVTCVGILLESGHVTFHTWPTEGVITFDMFTTGTDPPLVGNQVEYVESLFAIPRDSSTRDLKKQVGSPHSVQILKNRGYKKENAIVPTQKNQSFADEHHSQLERHLHRVNPRVESRPAAKLGAILQAISPVH